MDELMGWLTHKIREERADGLTFKKLMVNELMG